MRLTDITLRDGLQMEAFVPTSTKIELLKRLVGLGYSRYEVTSFVSPKWVPQFQDAEALCGALTSVGGADWMAFVPNVRGLERLLAFPIPWVSCFVAASETFNKKNVNQTVTETLTELGALAKRVRGEGRRLRVYVSTVWGCPYEGSISDETLDRVWAGVAALAPDEVALSDTIGVGMPSQVARVVDRAKQHFPVEKIVCHFHDTYGLAVAGALTAAKGGVTSFDGSTGGLGGCPYAKGATGNVATEALAYAFAREGHGKGFRQHPLKAVLEWMSASGGLKPRGALAEILGKGGTLYEVG